MLLALFSVDKKEYAQDDEINRLVVRKLLAEKDPNFKECKRITEGKQKVYFLTSAVEEAQFYSSLYKQPYLFERGNKGLWYEVDPKTSNVRGWRKSISQITKHEANKTYDYLQVGDKYFLLQAKKP